MLVKKKVIVVMPAYNAAKTLKRTFDEIPHDIVSEIVLVDDNSSDNTFEVAKSLGIRHVIPHEENKGYGGNQKTCYNKAIELGGEVIVMLHPDYQYTPKLIKAMVSIVDEGVYPVVFGSRILGKGALKGGMPYYKYFSNRLLTLFQNILMNQKLSEYHTGFRVFDAEVLKNIDYKNNSDDFIFDNQITAQIFKKGYEIGEVTCPTKYEAESSSINFNRSLKYGFGVIWVSIKYAMGLIK